MLLLWGDLDRAMRRRLRAQVLRFFKLFKAAIKVWGEDNGERLAAALSYYAIFSLAPALVIVIGLAGLIVDQERVESEVVLQIQRLVGSDGAEFVQQLLDERAQLNRERNLLATGVGIVTLMIGASGAFAQLQGALNTIWGVRIKPRRGATNFVRTRLFSFVILLLIGFMLLISLAISTWLVLIDDWLSTVRPELHLLFNLGNAVISFAVVMLLFALLYKVMPDVTIRWHDIWVGAAVTALLFNLGKWGIGLYLGNSTVASTFGAAGALVALLVWVYYSSQILLFGAVFIKIFATQRGRAVLPAPHAVNIRWTPEDHTLSD
jgi:membrane protein